MNFAPDTFRATIHGHIESGALAAHDGQTVLSVCDLAERHGRHLADSQQTVTFMGLPEKLTPVLADPRDGDSDWYFVGSVLLATGATRQQWEQVRDDEIAEAAVEPAVPPRVDTVTAYEADGTTHTLDVCNWQMALLLALDGPWGGELMANAQPAFRRVMVETGLGDQFQTVRIAEDGAVHETGESVTDAILAEGPLPSAEVAREQIRRGPLGALDLDGGHR
jgi:hypothetical protein